MSQYDKLNLLIVKAIKGGFNKFEAIYAGPVKDEAMRLHHEDWKVRGCDAKPAYRKVDIRLQSLRRRGLIEFQRPIGWIIKVAA